MKRILSVAASLLVVVLPEVLSAKDNIYQKGWIDFNKNGKKDIYEDPTQSVEKRVADLLSQMTMEEKTSQMVTLYGYGRVCKDELPTPEWGKGILKHGIGNIDEHLNNLAYNRRAKTDLAWPPSTHIKALNEVQRFFVEDTRLGIPAEYTNEGIRGLCHEKCTSFPSQIGVGATFDKELAHNIGNIIGIEAKLLGYQNVYSPILDVARDQRWGRVVECFGEDPYLVANMGYQVITGIQSQGVVASPKHFAIYSAPKGGRDGDARTDPHITERELHSIYLYPFKKAVMEAKAKGLMSSYNDYNGVPVTSSYYFMTELLRDKWGFDGYIVSDSRAVEFIAWKHHTAKDTKDAVAQAAIAGLNIRTDFTVPDDYLKPLRAAVNDGSLPMSVIDQRVSEILKVKFEEGLFDKPYGDAFEEADKTVANDEFQKMALRASRQAVVLLKNKDNILPIDFSKYRSVLVTGPNATAINSSVSRYGPSNIDVITPLAGIKATFPKDVKINYSKGCAFFDKNWPYNEIIPCDPTEKEMQTIKAAVEMAKQNDIIIAVMGDDEETVGESRSRTSLNLPGNQEYFLKELYKTGKPIILVMTCGRPMTINWADTYLPGVICNWFQGRFGGQAVAEILAGKVNPSGRLPISFPRTVGQLPLNFPAKPGSQADQPKSGPNGSGNTRIGGFLYPFGYGLSYTTFDYKNMKISEIGLTGDQIARVTVDVTNTGKVAGEDVVQLYFSDEVSTVTVYESQLRGFERVNLKPGETKQVEFFVTKEDLSLYNQDMEFVLEPGKFTFMVGRSSINILQKKDFIVK